VRSYVISPGFYTHAHWYVPSDSVWCEKDAEVVGKRGPRPAPSAAALNPYYVRARWKDCAKADPSVPRPAP
jgi:hypothetical protein